MVRTRICGHYLLLVVSQQVNFHVSCLLSSIVYSDPIHPLRYIKMTHSQTLSIVKKEEPFLIAGHFCAGIRGTELVDRAINSGRWGYCSRQTAFVICETYKSWAHLNAEFSSLALNHVISLSNWVETRRFLDFVW